MVDVVKEEILGEQIARRVRRGARVSDSGRLWWCPWCERSHQTEDFRTCHTGGCGTEFDPVTGMATRTVVTTEPIPAVDAKDDIDYGDLRWDSPEAEALRVKRDIQNIQDPALRQRYLDRLATGGDDETPEDGAQEEVAGNGEMGQAPVESETPTEDGEAGPEGDGEDGAVAGPLQCPHCDKRPYRTELELDKHIATKHT